MSALVPAKRSLGEDRFSSAAPSLNRSLPQKRLRTGHRQFQNPNPNVRFQTAHNFPIKGFPANRGGDTIQPIPRQRPPRVGVSSQPMSGSDLLRLHSSITSQRDAPKQETVWFSPYVSSQFMSDSSSVPFQFRHVNPACKSGSQVQMQNSFARSANLHVNPSISSSPPPAAFVSDSSVATPPANVMIPPIAPHVLPRNMSNFTPIPVQIPNVSCVTHNPKIKISEPIQSYATSHLNLHDKNWNLSQSLNNTLPGNALLELMKYIDEAKTQSQQIEDDDKVPSEFDAVWLKGRHECVISSLYGEIPRQCSSCGARFRTKEEHSKHMDWHVQKNRAKRRSTKVKPSRSYYPTASMFVDGSETAAPQALLHRIEVEKEEVELAVPVDDDQMFCALCQERLEEFFNDAGELMYRGAVFMKAPGRWKPGMETSLLGPIVHSKCLS